jgi:hypothetical protein
MILSETEQLDILISDLNSARLCAHAAIEEFIGFNIPIAQYHPPSNVEEQNELLWSIITSMMNLCVLTYELTSGENISQQI